MSENPFKGLRSFESGDKGRLFGRDTDLVLLKDRLYSGRTTLLFAASGVGKTSFLRAKVLPEMEAQFDWCYHNAWAGLDPRLAVLHSVAKALGSATVGEDTTLPSLLRARARRAPGVDPTAKPKLALPRASERPRECLLVLDQLEEAFQNHGYRKEFARLVDELVTVINDADVLARVLFAMREDFLGELSVFDNRIPDVFNNYYRLKNPDASQAQDIIVRTSKLADVGVDPGGLRRLVGDLQRFDIGLRAVPGVPAAQPFLRPRGFRGALRQLRRWALRVLRPARAVDGTDPGAAAGEIRRDFVIPPYLQIVCQRWWARTAPAPDSPFLSGYPAANAEVRTNPARTILAEFVREKFDALTTREKDIAARALDFLMTREGAKMPYELKRLAEHMDVDAAPLARVLEALSKDDTRILSRYPRPDGSTWFELYHDIYAPIVHEWKVPYQKRRASQQKWRTFGAVAGVTVAVLAVLWVGAVWRAEEAIRSLDRQDFVESYAGLKAPVSDYQSLRRLTLGRVFPYANRVWADYWDRRAVRAEVAEAPDVALLFRLKALRTDPSDERRRIAQTLIAARQGDALLATFRMAAPVTAIALSSDDALVATGARDGTVQVWDARTGTPVGPPIRLADPDRRQGRTEPPTPADTTGGFAPFEAAGVVQLSFSPDRTMILTTTAAGIVHLHSLDPVRLIRQIVVPKTKPGAPPAGIAYARFLPDGAHIAIVPLDVGEDGIPQQQQQTPRRSVDAAPRLLVQTVKGDKNYILPPTSPIMGLTASGDAVITADQGGVVHAWGLPTLAEGRRLMTASGSVIFSADGRRLADVGRDGVQLWSLAPQPRRVGRSVPYDSAIQRLGGVAFSGDGKVLAVLDLNDAIRIFDAETGKPLGSPIASPVTTGALALSHDGSTVMAQAPGQVPYFVNRASGRVLQPMLWPDQSTDVAVWDWRPFPVLAASAGRALAVGNDGAARLWAIGGPVVTEGTVEASSVRAGALALSRTGRYLVTLSRPGGDRHRVEIVDVASGKASGAIETATRPWRLMFNPTEDRLVVNSIDGGLSVYDVKGARIGGVGGSATPAAPLSLTFSDDGRWLLTFARQTASTLVDLRDGRTTEYPALRRDADRGPVGLSPNGSLLAFQAGDSVELFALPSGRRVAGPFERARILFDRGTHAILPGPPGGVRILTCRGESCTEEIPAVVKDATGIVRPLAVSRDGRHIVVAETAVEGAGRLRLWTRGESGSIQLPGSLRMTTQVVFSDDGRFVLARGTDSLRVWQTSTAEPVRPAFTYPGRIVEARFSPNGKYVLARTERWVHRVALDSARRDDTNRPLSGEPAAGTELAMLDDAGRMIRLVTRITNQLVRAETFDMAYGTGTKIEGKPSDLLEQWADKHALTINPEGQVLPRWAERQPGILR